MPTKKKKTTEKKEISVSKLGMEETNDGTPIVTIPIMGIPITVVY